MRLVRLTDHADPIAAARAAEAIFFATATVQSFPDPAVRAAFQQRWFGAYLDRWPRSFWLAIADGEVVIGYLAGCPDAPDMTDMGPAVFGRYREAFPAHLHINLAADWRGCGIGTALVGSFLDDLVRARIAGVHVVTAAAARNTGFYRRNGFAPLAEAEHAGKRLVLLGRSLF